MNQFPVDPHSNKPRSRHNSHGDKHDHHSHGSKEEQKTIKEDKRSQKSSESSDTKKKSTEKKADKEGSLEAKGKKSTATGKQGHTTSTSEATSGKVASGKSASGKTTSNKSHSGAGVSSERTDECASASDKRGDLLMRIDRHWRHLQCTRLGSNLNTTKNLKGWKQKKKIQKIFSVIFTKTNLLAVCIDVHPEKKNVVIYETSSNWKWKEDSATSESKRMLFDEINSVILQWNSVSHHSDICQPNHGCGNQLENINMAIITEEYLFLEENGFT